MIMDLRANVVGMVDIGVDSKKNDDRIMIQKNVYKSGIYENIFSLPFHCANNRQCFQPQKRCLQSFFQYCLIQAKKEHWLREACRWHLHLSRALFHQSQDHHRDFCSCHQGSRHS